MIAKTGFFANRLFVVGQVCELDGTDLLLPRLEAQMVIAYKGFDAN